MSERVLVVPRADYFGGDWPQGFIPLDPAEARSLAEEWSQAGEFVDRDAAEQDPSLKQPIPYCLLTRGPDIFVVRRRKKGTEGRLHGLHSVGLGGHIGPEDGSQGDPGLVAKGLQRELCEELYGVENLAPQAELIGLLNDDSNSVGEVHAGLVFRLEVPQTQQPTEEQRVKVREISKLEGGFRRVVEIQNLWQDPGGFETWSMLVLEALFNPPSDGRFPHSSIQIS
jgi:predicted NUDIX family phosphoesterase